MNKTVLDGKFAAYMQVEIQNDGPVTIQIDSPTTKNEVKLNKRNVSVRNVWTMIPRNILYSRYWPQTRIGNLIQSQRTNVRGM